ncbi:glycoside hydrolase family 13 protein [Halalkalirubrum salinum]|uniref:glycoside hydrolase family 13 protein n=1 Tax=Halalkalirubrum salinum TaxID=2563889 RepID=UPI0010FAD7DD|nr:alpha-glucosidase [Halalkalirubrum salinum]
MSETESPPAIDRAWWKESVVYQIYPRSFNDTTGDGVGDIPGIIEKVDYLDELGVDIIWLNPVYESPNADNGYDIADYRSIMDEFGTMDDWERLLDALHDRDIRLIMDLVVNHTSDEHEWFLKSRVDEEYRDYYIWRDGRTDVDGFTGFNGPEGEAPPNEWESFFGGPAWAYDEELEKWYMHLFDRKQPDLNWENPEVREEVFDMMQWWLEKGIDGFRMDVINLISKPDSVVHHDPPTNESPMWDSIDGPRVHEFLAEMHEEVLAGEDAFTIGEMIGQHMSMETAKRYVGRDGPLSTLFHFDHVLLDNGGEIWERSDWGLHDLRGVLTRWQDGLADDGWNSIYLSNHDQPRLVSRFGNDDEYRRESATLLATLIFTLRGTPYIFQGAEIGMTNYPFDSLEEFRDVETINPVTSALENGTIDSFESVKDALRHNSRDNARTPMQWDNTENGGFTDGEPWIGVNPNYEEINVVAAREDPDSVFNYYRELIDLRADNDVMVYGQYRLLAGDHDHIWAYTRSFEDSHLLVLLNFADHDGAIELPDHELPFDADSVEVERFVGNYDPLDGELEAVGHRYAELRPWEARVYAIEESQ